MSLAHMQRHGHRPIALVGGGTGLVGDPSGKTEMRKIMTTKTVNDNVRALKKQLSHFIDFSGDRALMANNADWLVKLGYIEFLRDYGKYFSVNRMIKAESYRMRIESDEGLSFIEFNYMLLQAYDFMILFDRHDCRLQMGGSDQWGNIVAGIDLVRRTRQETVFGVTFPLITTSAGIKMGKTHAGAVWLDADRTSPYDYFQYWVNTDDRDVGRFLALFTFLPMKEIRSAEKLTGADLNSVKMVLAYEATRIAHGADKATQAYEAARQMFGVKPPSESILPASTIPRQDLGGGQEASVPSSTMEMSELSKGIPAFKLLFSTGLANSSSASRRLIEQGGAYVNGRRIQAFDQMITDQDLDQGSLQLRSGKKRYHVIKVK
jgi:tyrosyl-tRNA synthetase